MKKRLRKLLFKIRKRGVCKANGYFCPDCIYHNFIWEGAVFRGNNCLYGTDLRKRCETE